MVKSITIQALKDRTYECEHCLQNRKVTCVEGKITIAKFEEKFLMPIDYWTLADYKKQWQEGIQKTRNNTYEFFRLTLS